MIFFYMSSRLSPLSHGSPPHDEPVAIGGVSILAGMIAITLSNIHRLVYILGLGGITETRVIEMPFLMSCRKGGPSICS